MEINQDANGSIRRDVHLYVIILAHLIHVKFIRVRGIKTANGWEVHVKRKHQHAQVRRVMIQAAQMQQSVIAINQNLESF